MITISYMEYDFSNGAVLKSKTVTVQNYRTLRSLLAAVDAACHEIEESRRQEAKTETGT